MERSAETTAAYIGSFLVNARRLKFGMILEGYLFFGTTLKFSRRKKRKTMSSQEGKLAITLHLLLTIVRK